MKENKRGNKGSNWDVRNLPLTREEVKKVDSYFRTGKPIKVIDTPTDFKKFLNHLDTIFGNFRQTLNRKLVVRGKAEYKSEVTDPDINEPQIVFTVSDPKTLYRDVDTNPVFIRVPKKSNLVSGDYFEFTIDPKKQNDRYIFFASSI